MCYGLDIALSTLSSCRCLHEPKTRFPVGRLFPFPGRESHPLEAPGLSWRTEEYLEIFDKFYADDVQVSSETQHEPIRGKARVGSLLLNFLVPLHVMAEVGGLAISIKETTISGDAANEIHSAWTLKIVGVSGKTCTLNWRTLRKWNGSRVVYEHHYDLQRTGEPLTFDDLGFDMIGPVAGLQGGQG